MKLTVRAFVFLFAVMLVVSSRVEAQEHPVDLDVHYTYMHTNVLPGCNCFSMQGGGGSGSFGIRPNLFAMANIDVTHAGSVTADNYDLTLTTYTFGVRYSWSRPALHLSPFGEFLLGASHASGSLAPGSAGLPGSSNAFALRTGGGLDIPLNGRLSLRPVQLDYVMTDFTNGKDNRQNNFQVSAGVVIHLRPLH
jgi:outer membrane immunogenic protein